MKNSTLVVVTAALMLVGPIALAVEEHHPDQKPAAAAPAPTPPRDTEQAVQQMKQNTDKLRAQMDKILKTRDAAERQKLMQEHMQTLREGMVATAGAMGGGPGGGMGMGMMGGGMMDCPMMSGEKSGDMVMQRMQQMEKRMDMMQMMLEQMQKSQEQKR